MSWDDGSHAKVKKVQLTFDEIIYSIQVTYDGATALQSQLRGSVGPKSAEFTLAPDEYITALSAYGKSLSTQEVITALTFTTNKTSYGPYGTKSGFQISAPEATGKQISGFLGAQKLEAQGNNAGGTSWDDGSDYDGVTKIYASSGRDGIQYVKFDYVKGGVTKQGVLHGRQARGNPQEFVINHPDEYLVSVEGWYETVMLGIQFKTNLNTYEIKMYDFTPSTDTKFTLQVQDKKIIGFHGFAGEYLNSIGAYFVPKSSTTPIGFRNIDSKFIMILMMV
ncbi:unnamed protein product [Arabidopsis thaliana]|uniref:(thale cress) hypothetical protein n=1 Tax=Arabidopsis thaliana TaxID=3702 RepID=A0A7G2EPP5_ARATH|nr:unnamed protein product [Arabidopsis thaliana]